MFDLHPAADATATVIARVTPDHYAAATPCAGFSVADLLAHLDEVAGVQERLPTHPAATAGRVRALAAEWSAPGAWTGTGLFDLSNATWGRIVLTELVVHGWDLARATGQPVAFPDETLRLCLDHVTEFIPSAPVPELWGPPVPVAPDACLLDRVLATTGRDPA
ncbi:maleylpyruvate isomerase family mycothiol-dependent enzyme [Actinokineospora pegani]|uniref:maleylpyruvate isomerase family mycothiol-dependent enzyme n=1 Tax=Actinokineospora pegani TaxID=2654637 RepID=UPI0012EA3A67|nr:maleylpyruvate isomerase family mycothiol-dependent enzyme [Actinokineospora pegani]